MRLHIKGNLKKLHGVKMMRTKHKHKRSSTGDNARVFLLKTAQKTKYKK